MKVVFVDPPSPPGFVSFRHAHGGYGEFCHTSRLKIPTLDLFLNASLLLEHGVPAAVVDSVLLEHSQAECVRAVLREKPSAVVLRTASGSCPHDLKTAARLRKRFGGPILLYGPQVAAESSVILRSGAVDAAVPGDVLFGLPDVLRGKKRPRGLLEIGQNGTGGASGRLASLPVPRWDLVEYRKYSFVTMQTSWGCPKGCGYCPYPVTQGRRWRARPVSSVVREMRALRDRYGLRYVMARDPLFTFDRERTVRLCRALIRAGVPILWGCETRLDTLDEGLIALMAKAGCIRVVFGVESVSPASLRGMGREPMTRARVRAAVSLLKRGGMLTYAFYMIGLPGETARSTEDMIEFALELDTDAASFSAATPFPGTRLARRARETGTLATADPLHLTSCVPSMRNEAMDAREIRRFYRLAKRRWKERKRKTGRSTASVASSLR